MLQTWETGRNINTFLTKLDVKD